MANLRSRKPTPAGRLRAGALLGLAACQGSSDVPIVATEAPPALEVTPPRTVGKTSNVPEQSERKGARTPIAGQEIAVPKGSFRLGSATGSAGRNASREADAVEIELEAFAIDALPYPNDPGRAPRALVSRDEASSLCRERGQRLCTELEWERACKGDGNQAYPVEPYEPAVCEKTLASCPSPLNVFALGTWGREWTSSSAGLGLGDAMRTVVVRGAPKSAPKELHRCAARDAATPDSKSESLLFRCCRGPASDMRYPEESKTEAFIEQSWDNSAAQNLLAAMPETLSISKEFKLFSAEQVNQRLLASGRSKTGIAPWQIVPRGLLWSPSHGEQIGVLAGDTKAGAMLIAFYRDASGRPVFGTSYQTRKEHEAIVVAYKADVTKELLFSTCWGCGGEGGAVEIGSDGRVRITPK